MVAAGRVTKLAEIDHRWRLAGELTPAGFGWCYHGELADPGKLAALWEMIDAKRVVAVRARDGDRFTWYVKRSALNA
jgi:hypothetical protein